MKTGILCAAAVFAVPFLSVSALADEPASHLNTQEKADEGQSEEAGDTADEQSAAETPEVKEEKRICRRVKLDMSSRRATKVCKTSEEWREFNQRR